MSLQLTAQFNPTFLSFNDDRRKILKVVFTNDNLKCVIKYSNNIDYMDAYEIERNVYNYFKDKKSKRPTSVHKCVNDVADLLSDDGHTVRNSNKKIEVNIEDYSGKRRQIYIPVSKKDGRDFYYLITAFDDDFIVLEDINHLEIPKDAIQTKLRDKGKSFIKLNETEMLEKALPVIIKSLGELNASEGFYHGDLKIDNVMINRYLTQCKHFDFDYSGILGAGDLANETVIIDYEWQDEYKGIDMIKILNKNDSQSKNIMFIFDIYRLFISIPSYSKKLRSDVTPLETIICSNKIKDINDDGIQFPLKLINDYFTKKYGIFDTATLIDIIGKKLKLKKDNGLGDWNYTLFHYKEFLDCCEYILEKCGQTL